MIKKIWDAIKNWYNGNYTPWDNEPGSSIVFIGYDHNLHWTAKLVRRIAKWYLDNWQWFWGILIAALTLLVSMK